MEIEEIIKRRAKMDIELDINCGELWGEDEIVNCIGEITQKLRETFDILGNYRGANLDTQIQYREPTSEDIGLWQEMYRIEKMFHILAVQDSRNRKIKNGTFQFDPVV